MCFRFLRGPQVIISVGPDKVQYPLPKGRLLQEDVPIFKAAFAGSFSEAAACIMDLPNEEVEVFDLFVEWLFGGTVPAIPLDKERHGRVGGHTDFRKAKDAGVAEYTKLWHKLARIPHRLCCCELEILVFEVLKTFHTKAKMTCHPILLDYDILHMPSSKPLEDFAVWSLDILEAETWYPDDHAHMLEYLAAKIPGVL